MTTEIRTERPADPIATRPALHPAATRPADTATPPTVDTATPPRRLGSSREGPPALLVDHVSKRFTERYAKRSGKHERVG
jgi:hypothetical protein